MLHLGNFQSPPLAFAVLVNKQKNPTVKPFLASLIALMLVGAPMGIANAASPKVGSACKSANQKIKVSNVNYLCLKSGKKLVWAKTKAPVIATKKPVVASAGKPINPGTVANPEKANTSSTPMPTPTKTAPAPAPMPLAPSGQNSSGSSSTAPSQENPAPNPSPSTSSSSYASPVSSVIGKAAVSLSSPTISGIQIGGVPKVGQVLSCSGWKWDLEVARTIVSWIAYPSNTGSDIIDPKLYLSLSEATATTESKLEITASNIDKISGNYLYCFAKGVTSGGLETTSIAAILLGK